MFVLLLLLLPEVRADVPTPSSLLNPRNFNHHPFEAVKFVKSRPSKNGPILFPNDAPPPPPTPLIVTSRPLIESIARSELNPNNTQTAQSQLNHVSYVPQYLRRVSNYKPYAYLSSTPVYPFVSTPAPFPDTKRFQGVRDDHFYTDYERILSNTIQRTKEDQKQEEVLRGPSYRRTIHQKPNSDPDKGSLYDLKEDTLEVGIGQGSLYSEGNDNIDDFEPLSEEIKQDYRRGLDDTPEYRAFEEYEERREPEGKVVQENKAEVSRLSSKTKSKYEASVEQEKRQRIKQDNTRRLNGNLKYRAMKESQERRRPENDAEVSKRRRKTKSQYEASVEHKEPVEKPADNIMEQSVPPLYKADPVNEKQQAYRKPDRPLQQRFKTQSRYGKQEQTPDYAHYDVKDRDSSKDYHHGDNYAFSYTVKDRKTGDDFSHSQQSTGSATNGEYRVRLPDGRMQIVSYTADENGYKADVRYDGHHDNSIDAPETSRERFQSKHPSGDTRIRYNDADIHSHEFPTNQEYPINDRTYTNYELKRPTIVEHKGHNSNQVSVNDFSENNDYIDPSNEGPNEAKSGGLTEHNNEYLEHYIERNALSNEKIDRAHDTDYFHYAEEIPFSKEIKDYSSESNVGYQPHKSKFSVYDDDKSSKSSVKPSYEELKRLFVTNYRRRVPDLTSFVSTLKPNYETTTEKVVVISPKKSNLYTNIRDIVSVTPAPLPYSTPSSYLVSTIANLKSKVNLISRPTLSNQFIEKINKYLTYK